MKYVHRWVVITDYNNIGYTVYSINYTPTLNQILYIVVTALEINFKYKIGMYTIFAFTASFWLSSMKIN